MDELLHDLAKKAKQSPPMRLKHWTREDIIKMLATYGLSKGAEIGVAGGRFSEFMCRTIPDIDLICVDPWEVGEDLMSQSKGQAKADERYVEAQKRLAPFRAKIMKMKSMDAVREIPYGSLDFVYIDGAHDFDFVMTDLIEWAKRVRKGGIVAGHDYYRFGSAGVIQAVDAYLYCHRIPEAFITSEQEASWFFVKR